MSDVRLPLRSGLEDLIPYGAPMVDVPVVLNVNENPYPPAPEVIASINAAVNAAATGLNRYPDREFTALRSDLSDYLEEESGVRVPIPELWAANGSNEVMLHLFQAFGGPGHPAVSFEPTYSMYPEYARSTLTRLVTGPRRPDFSVPVQAAISLITDVRPALILLASPNNPTGTALPGDDLSLLLAAARGIGPDGKDAIVVVDEAYGEFRRDGTISSLHLRAKNPHLVVCRTMSKAFGMAGLRLGYMAADQAVVDAVRVVRLPYHLSAITQATARAALAHRDSLMAQVASLRAERDELVEWLRNQGLTAVDSDANFVMFGVFPDRRRIWNDLLERGVLIREVGPDGYLRVTVGTPAEMAAFRAALEEVM